MEEKKMVRHSKDEKEDWKSDDSDDEDLDDED